MNPGSGPIARTFAGTYASATSVCAIVGVSAPRVGDDGSTSMSRTGEEATAGIISDVPRGASASVNWNHATGTTGKPVFCSAMVRRPSMMLPCKGFGMPTRSGVPLEARRRSLGHG